MSFGAEKTQPWMFTALGRLAEAEGDDDAARTWHHRAVAAARESPLAVDLADAVEGLAGIVVRDGAGERASVPLKARNRAPALPGAGEHGSVPLRTGERAAVLLGAAVALRGTAVTHDQDVDRAAARARDLIGAEAFAGAFARGAAMSRAEALTVVDETVSG
ncbi:hypothetical protein [Actinoallomurus acanthiterrae]